MILNIAKVARYSSRYIIKKYFTLYLPLHSADKKSDGTIVFVWVGETFRG